MRSNKKNEDITVNVIDEDISDALKKNAKTYADEANLRRAFPYVASGLKPVQLHILWAMSAKKRFHDKPFTKSAIIEGDCFSYSEHGSAYGAAARLAKPYIFHNPFIIGKGNFGTEISNPYEAASRYTEMKLSEFSEDTLLYDKDLIDMGLNYLESDPEPILNKWVSKLPILFMTCTEGMGYPIANRWSSCNLYELRDQIELYIKEHRVDCNALYPDFATGGIIINKSELSTLYSEGKGTIKLRGKTEIDGDTIRILSLPYQSYPEDFMEDIKKLVTSNTSHTIKDVRNKCGNKQFLIEVECEKDTAEYMLQILFKKTCLQDSYSELRKAVLPDGTIKIITLLDYVKIYVESNINLIKKEAEINVNNINHRLNILEGLLSALDIIDKIINDIKTSKSLDESKNKLIKRGFNEEQAEAIVNMKLGKLANLEHIKLKNEKTTLEKDKKSYDKLLNSRKLQEKKFLQQLNELVNKYGWERKTELLDITEDELKIANTNKPEKLKVKKEFMIVLTETQCLKKVEVTKFRQTDEDNKVIKVQNNQKVIIVSNKGQMYKVRVNQIDKCLPTASGTPISSIRPEIDFNNEKIIAIYSEDVDLPYIYFVTKNGLGKLCEVKSTLKLSKDIGTIICGIKSKDDEVISIKLLNTDDKIEITTNKDKYTIDVTSSKPQVRYACGKKLINFKKNESIIEVHSVK